MNVTPISFMRVNNNFVYKRNSGLSFQAKKVSVPLEQDIKPSFEKRENATVKEFYKHGINVLEIDKKDGLYTIDKIDIEKDNKEQLEFVEKHFHQIKKIKGNAYFRYYKLTSLDNLESIGGDAYFSASNITSLGNLKKIGGDAYFYGSKLTDLGNLSEIGGNADFSWSKVTSLGDLKEIGRNAYFRDSKLTDLGDLSKIGGDADFSSSNITSLGNLKKIGGEANFSLSDITDLGALEEIGEYAYFYGSTLPPNLIDKLNKITLGI